MADLGMKAAVKAVKPDITESQVAAAAEYAMRQAGAEDFYRTFVAFGPRTNVAHALPTLRKLRYGDLVMIDIAPVVNGYCADMCRTVCLGEPASEQRAAHDAYLNAQQSTIFRFKEDAGMADLEKVLHGALANAGHGDHIFGPPLHGVGIEFEEAPLPAGHAFFHGEKPPEPLRANTVIAVGNCGLYTEQWGVRIEDMVLVGTQGPQVLTDFPRRLEPE